MIYLIYGTNTEKARDKANSLLNILVKRKPDVVATRIDAEQFLSGGTLEYAHSQGLFEPKLIILYDNVFENDEAKEEVEENIKSLKESENIFIFLEGKLSKKTVNTFSKHAEKIEEHKAKIAEKSTESFKIFDLSDALLARDKKRLWVLYMKGRLSNLSAEEMHGILGWSARSMLLASRSESLADSGLNPFVYRKAKQGANKYSQEELKQLSSSFVELYHDARRGKHSLDIALERFILSL